MGKRYVVKGRYSASRDGKRFGPWGEGDTVELEFDDAAWIYRDSPGVLVAEDEPEESEKESPEESEGEESESQSRKVPKPASERRQRPRRDRGA